MHSPIAPKKSHAKRARSYLIRGELHCQKATQHYRFPLPNEEDIALMHCWSILG